MGPWPLSHALMPWPGVRPSPSSADPSALQAVLMPSEALPSGSVLIRGYEFGKGECTLDALMSSMLSTGLQASALGQAVVEVNRMVRKLGWRVWPCEADGVKVV